MCRCALAPCASLLYNQCWSSWLYSVSNHFKAFYPLIFPPQIFASYLSQNPVLELSRFILTSHLPQRFPVSVGESTLLTVWLTDSWKASGIRGTHCTSLSLLHFWPRPHSCCSLATVTKKPGHHKEQFVCLWLSFLILSPINFFSSHSFFFFFLLFPFVSHLSPLLPPSLTGCNPPSTLFLALPRLLLTQRTQTTREGFFSKTEHLGWNHSRLPLEKSTAWIWDNLKGGHMARIEFLPSFIKFLWSEDEESLRL